MRKMLNAFGQPPNQDALVPPYLLEEQKKGKRLSQPLSEQILFTIYSSVQAEQNMLAQRKFRAASCPRPTQKQLQLGNRAHI